MLFKILQSSCLAMIIALSFSAQARVEALQFENPRIEADYKRLVSELRCLVCQNQSLSDSNAELAQDMRKQVVEQLRKGATPDEIVAYMVDRYGDFVMYRPPFKSTTMLLWLGPLLFFVIAALVIVFFVRNQKTEELDLSEQQTDKAHSLLKKSRKS